MGGKHPCETIFLYRNGTSYEYKGEKLGDYVVNVVEARMGVRQHEA